MSCINITLPKYSYQSVFLDGLLRFHSTWGSSLDRQRGHRSRGDGTRHRRRMHFEYEADDHVGMTVHRTMTTAALLLKA